MPGIKTNERPGTRAVLRHFHMSASKARQVLDLIRGLDVQRAQEILANTPREAAGVAAKVLASAVANAQNNDGLMAEELYVAAAYADEGPTMKRFTPRARGRAGRIRKRTCHITIVVARMDDATLARQRVARNASSASRAQRVAASRRRADQQRHARQREDRAEAAEAEAQAAAAEAEAEQAETEATANDTAVEATATESTEIEASVETDAAETEATENDASETEAAEGASSEEED